MRKVQQKRNRKQMEASNRKMKEYAIKQRMEIKSV